jgi:hypothetical protein
MKATVTPRFYDGEFWVEITNEATGKTERLEGVYNEPDDVADALQKIGPTLSQARQLLTENYSNLGTSALKGITVPYDYASIH